MTADAWYFTRDGERLGPVSFSELREKVSQGGLNPRLDMVWKTGMEAWKPSGEIDGLFERSSMPAAAPESAPAATSATAATPAPAAAQPAKAEVTQTGGDPYAPPGEDVMEQLRSANWPGARRRGYLFMVMLFPSLWYAGMVFTMPMLAQTVGNEIVGFLAFGIVLVPLVASIVFTLKRFTNLGMSRWWIFGQMVPFLNLWVGYRLFACPAGYRYHKKLDGAGIALAIIYWLMILLVVASFVATIVLFAGMAGDPELQEKLKQIVENLQAQAGAGAPPPQQ